MLYIIGLGLNENGISAEGLEIVKRCKTVYLENYTVEFPYSVNSISELIGKKVKVVDREYVESLEIIDESVKKSIALLVYGDPLMATTHITIMDECRKSGVKYKVVHAASILDAVSETGLQIYKFGKIASMPKWDIQKKFEPMSFMETIMENKSIQAHSLILCDIGLKFKDAMKQLKIAAEKANFKNIGNIVVCSKLGTPYSHVWYDFIQNLEEKNINAPFCIIIPGKMHFVEQEYLEGFRKL